MMHDKHMCVSVDADNNNFKVGYKKFYTEEKKEFGNYFRLIWIENQLLFV